MVWRCRRRRAPPVPQCRKSGQPDKRFVQSAAAGAVDRQHAPGAAGNRRQIHVQPAAAIEGSGEIEPFGPIQVERHPPPFLISDPELEPGPPVARPGTPREVLNAGIGRPRGQGNAGIGVGCASREQRRCTERQKRRCGGAQAPSRTCRNPHPGLSLGRPNTGAAMEFGA